MNLSHTFKECLPDAQADMPTDVDIGFVIDCLTNMLTTSKHGTNYVQSMVVILLVEQGPKHCICI